MDTHDVMELIGNTPLIRLRNENIIAKAEFLNPGGSIKDRIGLAMIEAAERDGTLKPGMKIVEPTSGNTGIGITLVGAAKGYEVFIVMPEGMSEERKHIIKVLGGNLVLTPDSENIAGAIKKAEELVEEFHGYMPNQFKNPANALAHFTHTAPELWKQAEHKIDAFISGIGSGGTIQGVGSFLKERNPDVTIVAVEPKNVSALLGHEPGLHQIQGIGDGFIPEILNVSLIDRIIEVSDDDAIRTTRELASNNSLLCGTSSGANVWAARQIAMEHPEWTIATVLADRAERYFSTGLL
ncbi:cysteine synthase A [Syntrophus aciditrophicus]|uniref:Cysteine synthase n=1 Tax=Syntrophus aciditrophicus (strain SB) TaxID=56780 RepID=Q2LUV8_SYNAS|nr:cysteine synthase A [Syntrophus aciditrophicus]ABC77864.1 cysteine synthase [Syntrophus aciditrophicus SB]